MATNLPDGSFDVAMIAFGIRNVPDIDKALREAHRVLVKLEEDVRGRDCFVVSSTCAPVNDNLMELLIFIDCLRRASARRTTVRSSW